MDYQMSHKLTSNILGWKLLAAYWEKVIEKSG